MFIDDNMVRQSQLCHDVIHYIKSNKFKFKHLLIIIKINYILRGSNNNEKVFLK